MTGPVFVDTNVLVYRHDASEPSKQSRADAWIRALARDRAGRLSFQVLQEFYSVVTRRAQPPVPERQARSVVRDLMAWQPASIDLATPERAWVVQDRYSVSWWDALIVAAAQQSECAVLLTEDLQPGQKLGAVQVVDPFASPDRSPAEILQALER